MVGAGEDDALDALQTRPFIQVVHADDVAGQDGLESLLGCHAAHVHNGIDAAQHLVHRLCVGKVGNANLLTRTGRAHVGAVAQAQGFAMCLQARAQLAPQVAVGTGQKQAIESERSCGGVGHGGCSEWGGLIYRMSYMIVLQLDSQVNA